MRKLNRLILLLVAATLVLYLPAALLPGPLQAAPPYGSSTDPSIGMHSYPVAADRMYGARGTSSAGTTLTSGTATIRDWDKAWDAFDFARGQVCPGCGSRGGLPGDFFIGFGNGLDKRIHVFDSPGIIDMGAVALASVTSAPVSGYVDKTEPVEGHTYLVKSAGKYGKFRITDAHEPPTRTIAEWEIEWAYQTDGSKNLLTGTTQPPIIPPVVIPPPTTGGTPPGNLPPGGGLYENYKGSPDVGGDVRMQYWHGQTFTALSGHQVNSVKLLVYRIGNPGSLIVSLRATNASGHPSGPDLASGSTSGDTLPLAQPGEWREITLSPPVNLIAGTKYAIVARAPGGGGGNAVKWQTDSTSTAFTGGNRESSGDAGASWQSDLNSDYLFELWGPTAGLSPGLTAGGSGQSVGTPPSSTATTPATGTTSPSITAQSGPLHLSCINKDNLEKSCCCFQGAHTYKFGPYNVVYITAIFDTGRKLTCDSMVDLQVERAGAWETIKQVKASSGAGASELAPTRVDVQVNDTISGFRITDACACCIDNSDITLYLLGGTTTTPSTPGTGTTPPPSISTGTGTRLVIESRVASPGDTVLMPVRLENAQGIGSLGFTLSYNPAVIQYSKADKGAIIPADTTFVPNSPQPGTIIIAYATPGAINGNGTAVQLEFKAVGAQGSQSSLILSEITATGSGGGQVTVSPSNGQVTIGQKIKGDGNGDGQVTVLDALMALKMYVKAITESLALDVNSDGKVTPEDARQILKMAKPK